MTAHAAEFFTLDEVNRLKIIQDVVDRRLTTQMAAQRLGISDRQCRRLLSRYRESGPLGMANRRRGKPSNNQLPDGLARYALSIIRERYADFGPTLACEKLAELHDVHLSKETVRSLMVKAGFWVPRKQRAPKIQQPRYRRACCGELIQMTVKSVAKPSGNTSRSGIIRMAEKNSGLTALLFPTPLMIACRKSTRELSWTTSGSDVH